MNNIELYDNVMNAFNEKDDSFSAHARNWIEGADEANFDNAEANELFGRAKNYCATWRHGAINSRFAKRQMIECVRQIAEKGLSNPYKEVEAGFRVLGVEPDETKEEADKKIPEEKPAEENVKKEEKKPEQKTVKAEEPAHVLGVVPEEKKRFFKRHKE